MRLLIVNPNTSTGTTRRIDEAAQAAAHPGDHFHTVSAAFGPELIVTPEDGAEATRGVMAAIAQHKGPVDGIILASFGDTGAEEVRAKWPHLPVIGIAQAAFTAARNKGGPFAVVTFAPEVAQSLQDKAEFYGLGERLIRIAALPDPWHGEPGEVVNERGEAMADLCAACVEEGALSIVIGGGPLAGLAARIGPRVSVPLIDGTQEAIAQIRARIGAKAQEDNLA